MTLAQKVQALQIGSPNVPGLPAARQILAAILAPTKVEGTAQVARPGAAAERALRALVVPAVMTGAQWNTRASAGTLGDTISNVLAGRVRDALAAMAAAQDVAAKVAAMASVVDALGLAYQTDNQERVVRRRGGEPYAVAAGTDTRSPPAPTRGRRRHRHARRAVFRRGPELVGIQLPRPGRAHPRADPRGNDLIETKDPAP